MADFHQGIGKRIKELREKRGYSCEELAFLMSIDTELMEDVEQGKIRVFVEHISKMAILFNVTTDYLIYGTDNRK